jgi:hypothetical protein
LTSLHGTVRLSSYVSLGEAAAKRTTTRGTTLSDVTGGAAPDLGIATLHDWDSRSISAENPTGEPSRGGRATEGTGSGHARDLGPGWKISPSIAIPPGDTKVLADIRGRGAIQHIWMSMRPDRWRSLVLRFRWDDAARPAVEVPLGDFFCSGWDAYSPLSSRYVLVAPYCGLNSYWPMPFNRRAEISLENIGDTEGILYYYIDYGLGPVPDDAAYFHAYWNRSDPVGASHLHEILPTTADDGSYVGTYLAFGSNYPGWWGEGEVRFFLDGDEENPTICGTGTEDYFGGAWNFDVPGDGYTTFSGNYCGLHQILWPDGLYQSQQRFGMYRWHESDAVRFRQRLRVDLQDLGWRPDGRYKLRSDDIATTAFWYGRDPSVPHHSDLSLERLEVRSLQAYGPSPRPRST